MLSLSTFATVRRSALLCGALLAATFCAVAPAARAQGTNLDISQMVERNADGTPVLRGDKLVARDADFANLMAELSLVMTPSPMQPAETTGQAGFEFGLDYTFSDINEGQAYWRDAFANNNPRPVLQTLGVKGRKGFILPIPLSSELEMGATWLVDSAMWNLGANVRVALHEMGAFQPRLQMWTTWFPDIAIMGGVSRLIGTDQINLLNATYGVTASKNFSVAGTFSLTPFVNYQFVHAFASSSVLDADRSNVEDITNNFVFAQQNIEMTRLTPGARLVWGVVNLSAAVDINTLPAGETLMQYNLRFGLAF